MVDLLEFLRNPSSFPHHPQHVEIRQTHASVLAIAPPFVYKVKKRVNLGFLDFTQLEERKRNCERELELNSRFCAGIYLAVLPIAMKHGQLFFGTAGEVVDYALQMKQLPDGYFLNQLLQAGKVTHHMLDTVLEILKDFYKKYPSESSIAKYGNVGKIREVVEENITTLEQHTDIVVYPASLEVIRNYFHRFFQYNQELFTKRVQEQRIQDCHGDLHLEHIHIRKGKVCIYDCIEFNDSFRYIDVASDIAFLAMDFDYHGRPDLSLYVTTRMAELLHDPDLMLLANFYKCYRACVRAKVECIKASEQEVTVVEREASREEAKGYVSLALQYALFNSEPAVLIVCGRSGCGKTTLAESLAKVLNWKCVSSDVLRKEAAGLPLYQRSDPKIRQSLYALPVTDKVYHKLLEETLALVKNRQGVVIDATFGLAKHREFFGQALAKESVPYYFLEMKTSEGVMKKRLAIRNVIKQVVSDARLEDFDLLRRIYQEPNEVPSEHLLEVNADAGVEETLARVLKKVLFLLHTK
ncbi:bifunctional aminoglycoside phosphotransferase/ATP-binding protein [Pontibacter pamirensis]|uniref:bifunctional aminoglycoside phosphotransferase/ATP-binding protein n=1 Tax=Pontibacter pamirensis TaxID=2562824 RepID=UPI00138A24C5|nr:bifunctional aminoglycoside phosphotransferase/ATP-binding protein [Pontibacter pamirensis]